MCTEPMPAVRWGFTDGWYANEVGLDRAEARKLQEVNPDMDLMGMLMETTYPYDSFELHLRRATFTGARWSLRLAIHLPKAIDTQSVHAFTLWET